MEFLSRIDSRLTMEFLMSAEEDQRFDRKRANIAPKDLATHIIGFANANGGTLVIGQGNDKTLYGEIGSHAIRIQICPSMGRRHRSND